MSRKIGPFLFPGLPPKQLIVTDPVLTGGVRRTDGLTKMDFLQWAYGDMISNVQRGMVAEWLVAHALNLTEENRVEWEPWDLELSDGTKVEVKSASIWQPYDQMKRSEIIWAVGPLRTKTGTPRRPADVYVFGALICDEKSAVDPFETDHWRWFVARKDKLLPTAAIKDNDLTRLIKECGAEAVDYDGLAAAIDRAKHIPTQGDVVEACTRPRCL